MLEPSGLVGVVARDVQVTWVVQIPSPCAMVARRRTGVPRSRPNASVSASQSCGNSAATCATVTDGQLTIGTDNPAYPPWFAGGSKSSWKINDPSTGKGFGCMGCHTVESQ